MNPTPVSDKSILVVGLVRNCGKNLSAEVEMLRSAFAVFGSVSWLVIESDSTDDTPAVLEQIDSSPAYAGVGYVAMADLDGVNTQFTGEALLSCWSRTDWDV